MPLEMQPGDDDSGGGSGNGNSNEKPDHDRPDHPDKDSGDSNEKSGGEWLNERSTGWLGVDTDKLGDRAVGLNEQTKTTENPGISVGGEFGAKDEPKAGVSGQDDPLQSDAPPGIVGERVGPWVATDNTTETSVGNFLEGAWTGAKALWENYQEMKAVNTIGADDYFHCVAHCQATEAGPGGEVVSEAIGHVREVGDFLKNVLTGKFSAEYMYKDCGKDFYINERGRDVARSGTRCNEGCRPFRKGF